MRITKKILSVVISALMVVSVMPMTVFAAEDVAQVGTTSTAVKYDSLQAAINAAVESGASKTVKLLTDTTEDIVIPNTNGKTLTLKTNGKTITSVSSSAITVQSGAIVVMNDTGSVVSTMSSKEAISNEFGGKITIGTSSYAPKINRVDGTTGYVIKNQGTMIIENATVTNGNANDTSALVANGWYNNDEAVDTVNLTIKKGTYTSTKGITVKNDAKGVLNISGGTFTHGNNSDNVQNWNIATISGGTFNNRVRTIKAKDDTSIGQTTITGGIFNGEIVVLEYYTGFVGTTAISGGTFVTKPNADFIVAENVWYYENAAGKYVMTTATPSVKVAGKQYPSMSVALAQNNYEGEYTLIADVPSFVLPDSTDKADKTIVLNLNDHSVTNTGSGSAIKINGSNAKVTINGPGNVYAGKNSSTAATTVASAVWVTKVADVTINGGNYYAYTTTAGKANPVLYLDAIDSTLTVNDGNFVGAEAETKDSLLKVRPTYAHQANYVLNGGTYSADPSKLDDVTLGDKLVAKDNGNGTFTVDVDLDFSAFDAVMVTVNNVTEKAYTADSITALKTVVAGYNRATLTTQDDIDAAAVEIQTALNALEVKKCSVKLVVVCDGEDTVFDEKVSYGQTVVLNTNLDEDLYKVYKWTMETDETATKLASDKTFMEVVVNDDVVYTAYAQHDMVEDIVEYTQHVYLTKNREVFAIKYTESSADNMRADIDFEAQEIPFYTFDCWTYEMNEENNVIYYIPTYTVNAGYKKCNIIAGENVKVSKTSAEYDAIVYASIKNGAEGKLALSSDGTVEGVITYLDGASFHCPMTSQIYVILVEETKASVGVTGYYTDKNGGNTILAVNAKNYLPAGASLVECGVVYTSNGKDVKVKSNSQSELGEYTIRLIAPLPTGITVKAKAYMTYTDKDNNLVTVESASVDFNL